MLVNKARPHTALLEQKFKNMPKINEKKTEKEPQYTMEDNTPFNQKTILKMPSVNSKVSNNNKSNNNIKSINDVPIGKKCK